jgi:Mg2+-importing ATPase
MKYVLMATSSNFGNMFSAAGASVFLSFLPDAADADPPQQPALQRRTAGDPDRPGRPEALARPAAWDMKFIRRFMSVFGPISSIFDFVTFWVMLALLHAGHVEFRTGWFVESIATQTLVVYVIRTRRVPFFKSRPSLPCSWCRPGRPGRRRPALHGAGPPLGFTPLPTKFFLLLFAMVVVYLVLVELAKTRFSQSPRLAVTTTTDSQRLNRRIMRRASRFIRHEGPTLR